MKKLIISVSAVLLLNVQPAKADLQQTAIDDCLLENLTSSKLDSVAKLITRTCTETYKTPNFLTDKKVNYNQCLLKYLQGVESQFAADRIVQVCEKRHLRFGVPVTKP